MAGGEIDTTYQQHLASIYNPRIQLTPEQVAKQADKQRRAAKAKGRTYLRRKH